MADTAPRAPHRPRVEADLTPAEPALEDDATIGDVAVTAAWQGESAQFAELHGVRLGQGSLAGSRWYRGTWADVVASDVDLANAVFSESGWTRVQALRCRATGLTLAGCTLGHVELAECRAEQANLRFATVTRTRLIGCSLANSDFGEATLSDVEFRDCRLDGADFSNARCQRVRLTGCTIGGLKGVTGLRGATIDALDVYDVAQQLAAALGIRLA